MHATDPLPSRRDLLVLGAGVFVVAAMPWRRRRLVRRSVPLMGTVAEVAVVARDVNHAQRAIDAALQRLRDVDRDMSRFRADSDIGRANRLRTARVGRETAFVVERALRWAERTDGAFDPCLGRVTELWDVIHRSAPPGGAEHFAGRRLFTALDLDGDVIALHDPDVALDLGGIAKGYGVDVAVRALRDWGITDGLVNVGGDLYALGVSVDGDPWRVGVRGTDVVLSVTDEAVATSGLTERYFVHKGRRYHHLLDPTTGAPRTSDVPCRTVRAETCMDADARATASFVEGGPGV